MIHIVLSVLIGSQDHPLAVLIPLNHRRPREVVHGAGGDDYKVRVHGLDELLSAGRLTPVVRSLENVSLQSAWMRPLQFQ